MMPQKMKLIVSAFVGCLMLTSCGGGSSDELLARYTPLSLESADSLRVNGYLWQATLDTLDFMSIESTDATGGVIVTDWYTNPRAQNERTKVRVAILDPRLRADALSVDVSRQARNQNSQWVDMPVQQSTVAALEDAILTQARQIRIRTVTD